MSMARETSAMSVASDMRAAVTTNGHPAEEMHVLVLATGNQHKVDEITRILAPQLPGWRFMKLSDALSEAGITTYQEPEETGATFLENARIKARDAYKALKDSGFSSCGKPSYGKLNGIGDATSATATKNEQACAEHQTKPCWWAVVADDSGLEVDALEGRPGVYSARYAGAHGDNERNRKKVLAELAGVPTEQRTAQFVCQLVCITYLGNEILATGHMKGSIIDAERGEFGFGYDPIFTSERYPHKTNAELLPDEKHAISHRGKASSELAQALTDYAE